MPIFHIEVESEAEIDIREFVDQCSTEELKELVDYLVELKLVTL